MPSEIYGVYLSPDYDLGAVFDDAIRAAAPDVILHNPQDVPDPAKIRFTLCWKPAATGFDPYPNLGFAMAAGAGVDALLAHPGLPPALPITRIRDPHQADMMAGFAAHEVLHVERGFDAMARAASDAQWAPPRLRVPAYRRVAVLGHGSMGRAVARALAMLGFAVTVACRSTPADPLDGVRYVTGDTAPTQAAQDAHYLINVLPLTAATTDILDDAMFDALAPGAWLIQIGRGEHLVEAALLRALDKGQLSGATLDVFRTEPLPPAHGFWRDPRLRLTPHIASDSAPETVAQQLVACAHALRDGAPIPYCVDRARGY